MHNFSRLSRQIGPHAVPNSGSPQHRGTSPQLELDRLLWIDLAPHFPQFFGLALMTARHQPQIATIGFGHIVEHVKNLDLHKRETSIQRRPQKQHIARQIGMPCHIAVSDLLILALANANIACFQTLGIRRSIVQMRGADLNIPANRIHHQRQHARMIDQIEKRLVLRQGIPHGKRIIRPQALGLSNPLCHLVNSQQKPIDLVLSKKILENNKSLLIKILLLLLCHRKSHKSLLLPAYPSISPDQKYFTPNILIT